MSIFQYHKNNQSETAVVRHQVYPDSGVREQGEDRRKGLWVSQSRRLGIASEAGLHTPEYRGSLSVAAAAVSAFSNTKANHPVRSIHARSQLPMIGSSLEFASHARISNPAFACVFARSLR